ncbi:MAG: hypothetical protein WKF57_14880 [Nakamurella sp.]
MVISPARSSTGTLHQIVKAYDIRGLVGEQLTEAACRAIGVRSRPWSWSARRGHQPGRRGRPRHAGILTGPGRCLHRRHHHGGVEGHGRPRLDRHDVLRPVHSGYRAPCLASHNPARQRIKLCLAGAVPLSLDTGLAQIRDQAQSVLDGAAPLVADIKDGVEP